MPKFAIKHINTKKGKMVFKQLVVLDNKVDADKIQLEINQCEAHNKNIDEKKLTDKKKDIPKGVVDIYEEEIQHTDRHSLRGIFALMDLIVDLQKLSETQFRPLQPKSDDGDFEIKRGDLRVFGINSPGGKLIIKCGHKNTQDEDITHFRSIKAQYLESIKPKKIDNGKRRIAKK